MFIPSYTFNECASLQELCNKLNAIHADCIDKGLTLGDITLGDLPVFSDDVPDEDCLSWNDKEILYLCEDGFYIDNRSNC